MVVEKQCEGACLQTDFPEIAIQEHGRVMNDENLRIEDKSPRDDPCLESKVEARSWLYRRLR